MELGMWGDVDVWGEVGERKELEKQCGTDTQKLAERMERKLF